MRAALVLAVLVGALTLAAASGSILLTTYTTDIDVGGGVTSQAYAFDPASGETTLLRGGEQTLRPAFPSPADPSTLRRDQSFYVPSLETVYEIHSHPMAASKAQKERIVLQEETGMPSAKKRASAPVDATPPSSEFWGYSLFQNESTFIQPAVGSSISCVAYSPLLDIVLGISFVPPTTTGGNWNATMVMLEYNGDFYDYFDLVWAMELPDPTGTSEDPSRPPCAFDAGRTIFSFHWPAATSAPAASLGGTLYSVNVTYLNFTPVGTLIGQEVWPPVNPATGVAPLVIGLAYTPVLPDVLLYLASRDVKGDFDTYVGSLDPVTGTEFIPPRVASLASEFAAPRLMATTNQSKPMLIIAEYVSPFRYLTWNINASVLENGVVASLEADQQILGLMSWE